MGCDGAGTVPLSVAGVTCRGPVDGSDVSWDLGSEADREAGWGQTVPLSVACVTCRGLRFKEWQAS
jgi:hypothetical protein